MTTTPAPAAWPAEELDRVGAAEELHIASRRPDGTLRPYVTIWVVQVGHEIYVRSAYGVENPWYVRARASGTGRIRADGIERDVRIAAASDADSEAINAAYHTKYDRYGARIVDTVVSTAAAQATLRLTPQL